MGAGGGGEDPPELAPESKATEEDTAEVVCPTVGMSVKELKKTIAEAGLSHADCFEKPDLRARAVEALNAGPTAPGAAATPCKVQPVREKIAMELSRRISAPASPQFSRRRYDVIFDAFPLGFGIPTSDPSVGHVQVTSVKDGGKAHQAGVRKHDTISFVNGEDVQVSTSGHILTLLQGAVFPLTITLCTVSTFTDSNVEVVD